MAGHPRCPVRTSADPDTYQSPADTSKIMLRDPTGEWMVFNILY